MWTLSASVIVNFCYYHSWQIFDFQMQSRCPCQRALHCEALYEARSSIWRRSQRHSFRATAACGAWCSCWQRNDCPAINHNLHHWHTAATYNLTACDQDRWVNFKLDQLLDRWVLQCWKMDDDKVDCKIVRLLSYWYSHQYAVFFELLVTQKLALAEYHVSRHAKGYQQTTRFDRDHMCNN